MFPSHHKKMHRLVIVVLFSLFGRRVDGFSSKNYDQTSVGVKGIVSGLTSLTNALFRKGKEISRSYDQPSLSPTEVLSGVIGDFENGYLFSGGIDTQIYTENCRFTDPTLSFVGLSTFENNIRNLKPVLNFFVANTLVVLYNAQLNEQNQQVKAQWRMSGSIRLPWQPKLELTGNTALSYNQSDDGRIFDYFEQWDLDASNALFQLLQPAQIIPTASFPDVIDVISANDEIKNIPGVILTATTEKGGSRQQKTINVSKVKDYILHCLQNEVNGKLSSFMMPLLRSSVRSLIQAVPLDTLQQIQMVGDVNEGIQKATSAAFARLVREQWILQCISSTNANDEPLGNRGAMIHFSSSSSPSMDIVGNIVTSQFVESSGTTVRTTQSSYMVVEQSIQFLPQSSQMVEDVSNIPWQLGFYDDDWMVFVRSDGDFLILTKKA